MKLKETKEIQEEDNRHEEKYKKLENLVKEEKATLAGLEQKNKDAQAQEL